MKYFITSVAAVAALAVAAVGSLLCYNLGGEWWNIAVYLALCALFFPLAAVLHELGHKLFGALSGMKVRLGRFAVFSPSSCTVEPVSAKNIRRGFILTACGGMAVNFIFAVAGIVCLCFGAAAFASFIAPSSLYLLIINAVPTGSAAEATDMRVIADAAKNTAEWRVLERALTIQGMLCGGTPIAQIDEKLFFDVPQIAEDEPAFIMLVSLRAEYFAARGDEEAARMWSERLEQLKNDYL